MSPAEERRSLRHTYVDRQFTTPASQAVMLIGHGSVRSGAGAAMIRLAERVYQAGVAPIVAAGFLNYRRPTFDEALQCCIQAGARWVFPVKKSSVPPAPRKTAFGSSSQCLATKTSWRGAPRQTMTRVGLASRRCASG